MSLTLQAANDDERKTFAVPSIHAPLAEWQAFQRQTGARAFVRCQPTPAEWLRFDEARAANVAALVAAAPEALSQAPRPLPAADAPKQDWLEYVAEPGGQADPEDMTAGQRAAFREACAAHESLGRPTPERIRAGGDGFMFRPSAPPAHQPAGYMADQAARIVVSRAPQALPSAVSPPQLPSANIGKPVAGERRRPSAGQPDDPGPRPGGAPPRSPAGAYWLGAGVGLLAGLLIALAAGAVLRALP